MSTTNVTRVGGGGVRYSTIKDDEILLWETSKVGEQQS